VLAALRCQDELALHVRAALEDGSEGGLGADEIKEVLLQVAIYAGVPAANSAFAVAQRTIAQHTLAQHTLAERDGAETSR
jgi:4-carboxymuconolactone decarboxylase